MAGVIIALIERRGGAFRAGSLVKPDPFAEEVEGEGLTVMEGRL
jgi:hypothetical protein